MKKYCFSILIGIIICTLLACKTTEDLAVVNQPQEKESSAYTQYTGETENTTAAAETSTEEKQGEHLFLSPSLFPELVDSHKNYEVYSAEVYHGYYYRIYDNQGKEITHGYSSWKFAGIEAINDSLLMLTENNAMALFSAQYFDVENGRISPFYPNPLGACSDLVAYFEVGENEEYLVVRDLFDADKFYCEFRDESFSTSVFMTSCTATFSEDHSSVTIYYPDPTTYETISKTFLLKTEEQG